jgi:hypothetical protein
VSVGLSQFTFLLVFKLKNANVNLVMCDVVVFADTFVGENNMHHIASLSGGCGMYWGGESGNLSLRLNVIGRHYPLVSHLTTFWFGPFRDIASNWWNQTSATVFSGINVGMAFSWQNISVLGNDFACLSVIFRSGNHYVDQPVLTNLAASSESVSVLSSFSVRFSVSDPVPGSSIRVYLVIDQDIAGITLVETNAKAGSNNFSIDSSAFPPGMRVLWFYAVNELGLVSDGVSLRLLVSVDSRTPGPPKSRSRTPIPAEPPSQQPSPSEAAPPGLSGGAVAGIAIGSAVLGIVAIVLIIILIKRRAKGQAFEKVDPEELTSQVDP